MQLNKWKSRQGSRDSNNSACLVFILCEGRGGVCRGSQLLTSKFLEDSIHLFYSENLKEERERDREGRESGGGSERHYV
jgi:hypothetical protein